MSVTQTLVIDAVGTHKETGAVHLTVADHLEWDSAHLVVLQDKLNAYFEFVESGQLVDSYPDAEGRAVVVDVVLKYRPNEPALAFLSRAASFASERGWTLRFLPRPTGYEGDC